MDKGLLNEATSADDSPTPGYMLTEISRLTVANYQACLQLIEFLNARLKKNNHNVKYKCLVVVKHVCRTGRADFKKEMARNLDAVKECLQYKGPPDPLRGDEIYRRVRDAAKEALDAIFDSQMPLTTSSVANRIQGFSSGESQPVAPQATQASSGFSFFRSESNESSYVATEGELTSSRMTGFGNSSMNNPPAASTPSTFSSTGMTGIGNPNFKDPRNEVSWTKKISALAEGALGSSTQPATSDYQMRSNRESPFGETHKTPAYLPSNPGPWNPSASHGTSSPLNTPSGGIVPDIPSIAGGLGRAGHAASDGAYEQSLIASLCEAGGMKAAPPDDKLEEFLTAAPTLSPEFIGSSLVGFINSDAWQSRAKALVVVGALAKRSGCAQHMGWWIANGAEDIQILAQTDSKATVKTQAIKTLRALGISSNSASIPVTASQSRTTSAVSVTTTSSGNSVSLLDFENELSTPNVPTVPESHPRPVSDASTTPADGAPSDLFDGLALGSPAPLVSQPVAPPVQPPQSTNSLFDFMETPPSNPPQNQQHTTLDLNSLYGPPVVTPPPPPPTMAPLAGLNLSVPVRMPQQYPPHMQHQGYPSAGFPPPQNYPAYPQQPPLQQQYTPMMPSAMGQNNPQLGVRKVIPDATSGFSFLDSNGTKKNPDDAFSFVKDAMTTKK